MNTLAPIKSLEQEAIAKKIKELLNQLTLRERLEIEGEVTRSISEELAEKKKEYGNNKEKWAEYQESQGITKKDANKRLKFVEVPRLLWSVGTIMAMQLSAPMFEDTRSQLLRENVITQEMVEQMISDVRSRSKQEREEAKAQSESESKFLEWTRDPHGIRTLLATIHEAAGNKIEHFFSTFRKASDGEVEFNSFISEMLQVFESSDRWEEIEAIAELNEINEIADMTPDNIPLSQVGPGMRIEVVNTDSPFFGQQARIVSYNNGSGWCVIFDSEMGKENPQSEWAPTADVKIVAI
jgi:hypothetical protein